jgi:hypothetical protein
VGNSFLKACAPLGLVGMKLWIPNAKIIIIKKKKKKINMFHQHLCDFKKVEISKMQFSKT